MVRGEKDSRKMWLKGRSTISLEVELITYTHCLSRNLSPMCIGAFSTVIVYVAHYHCVSVLSSTVI